MAMAMASTSLLPMTCPLRQQLRSSFDARSGTIVKAGVRGICRIVCCDQTTAEGAGHADPPKLEPFSQSRLSRAMRERSFLRKAEDAMNEKCMVLEGEDAFECWEALFDYENMKEEAETECTIAEPGERQDECKKLERLENMVRQSGGVNSLIDNVRMMTKIKEANKQKEPPNEQDWLQAVADAGKEDGENAQEQQHEFLEDGGIPKTQKELQEEMDALLPESPFSRFLKWSGHHKE
ncbi:unnamed protein product [Calypogeia fissa]